MKKKTIELYDLVEKINNNDINHLEIDEIIFNRKARDIQYNSALESANENYNNIIYNIKIVEKEFNHKIMDLELFINDTDLYIENLYILQMKEANKDFNDLETYIKLYGINKIILENTQYDLSFIKITDKIKIEKSKIDEIYTRKNIIKDKTKINKIIKLLFMFEYKNDIYFNNRKYNITEQETIIYKILK